ncbi:MAG: sugar ABC transporter ATP-binding protein [Anaerolineae bacterium]|nr:sugar ABC transporter ATP-binding protein [Anaerolineae bacterium]
MTILPCVNLLEMHAIVKHFPGVTALNEVEFDIKPGEVHMLLGENGAGKSTLIKILSGLYPPDMGEIIFKGDKTFFSSPRDAQRAGISVIYQEPTLIPSMNVAENIYLGDEPTHTGPLVGIDETRLMNNTMQLFDYLNITLDPFALVSELSLPERQMVAIARALHLEADLVIMDEPTAMLNQSEAVRLFTVIRNLRSKGISILYVTHRLEEAIQIGDRATILRDGRCITTRSITDSSISDLASLIVGRDINEQFECLHQPGSRELLRLENISSENGIQDISFHLNAGEVLGITGLIGAGGTSILRAIFAADPINSGQVYIDGEPMKIRSPQEAISFGIGLLTEDRQGQGLILEMKTLENMSLASLEEIGAGPFIDLEAESNITRHYAQRLNIHLEDLTRKVQFLSGGTQQKVVLSRWLANQCRILLLDEPTRGVDVGARLEFYHLIDEMARRGVGIIIVSSNLHEIFNLSDRIIVMRYGKIARLCDRHAINAAEVLSLAGTGNI